MTTIERRNDAIALGIVTANGPALIDFYCKVIGLADNGDLELPGLTVRMLGWGINTIKIVQPKEAPEVSAPPGGIVGATGYRYWTLTVDDIASIIDRGKETGIEPFLPLTEYQKGISVAVLPDPDGNLVELVSYAE